MALQVVHEHCCQALAQWANCLDLKKTFVGIAVMVSLSRDVHTIDAILEELSGSHTRYTKWQNNNLLPQLLVSW